MFVPFMDRRIMERRALFLERARAFFRERGHLEVDTPLAAPRLIPEPSIEVFPVRWADRERTRPELYLLPSPELWMRRLLAAGSGSIFQICHCFRNMEETGPHHAPEFTMLEWYTVGAGYRDSLRITADLLDALEIRKPVTQVALRDLFGRHTGLDLDTLDDEESIRAAASRAGIDVGPGADWEECFHKLFLTTVEPELKSMGAVFVLDYPARIPALARRVPGTPYIERWELYVDGIEIANCYGELTDPIEVRRYLEREEGRKASALVRHPAATDLGDLELPPCSGVALGLDRLFLVAQGLASLGEVIYYPRFGIL